MGLRGSSVKSCRFRPGSVSSVSVFHSAMSNKFDPYFEWLGISPAEQPADYYRLLGLELFETDPDSIRDHADERMEIVRRYHNGKYSKYSQRILNEISAARSCLLKEKLRRIYDAKLRRILAAKELPPLEMDADLSAVTDIPEDFDPFQGTAILEEGKDLLEPAAKEADWMKVVVVGIVVIIVLAFCSLMVMK